MYLDKLELLLNELSSARIFNFSESGKIHPTNHNEFLVEMTHYDSSTYRNESMKIKFKDSSEQEFFTVVYNRKVDIKLNNPRKLNDHSYSKTLNNSLSLFINNLKLDDKHAITKLLEKVNFESFLDNEIRNAKNEHEKVIEQDEQKKKLEYLEAERITQSIVSQLDNVNSPSKIDLNKIKNTINAINHYDDIKFFVPEYSDNPYASQVENHQEKFENFLVSHKKITENHKMGEDKKNEISFVDEDKHINFKMIFSRKDFGSIFSENRKYEYFYIDVDGKYISEPNLLHEIIAKTGADRYLDSLLGRVQTLSLAKEAKDNLILEVEKKVTAIKAQALLDKLSNNNISQSSNLDIFSLEINGSKVWTNNNTQLHREDGPAIENYNGRDFWFKNGQAYFPEGKQEIFISENESRKYDGGVLIQDKLIPVNPEPIINDKNPHHKGVFGLVDKFRSLFSSDETTTNKKKKPKV